MDHVKHWLDASAVVTAFSSFMGWLPQTLAMIASTLSIIWLSIQIHDRLTRKKKDAAE